MGAISKEDMLDRLLCAHEVFYDVERDHGFAGRRFPGYAEFHSQGEKYVLSKKAKLWEVNAHEYLFFQLVDRLDESTVKDAFSFMTHEALGKVELVADHMTSYLSLVFIADEVSERAAHFIKRARFRKSFALGFKGWADVRLAAIDLGLGTVMTNGQGKELRSSLEGNLRKAQAARANE